MENNKILWIGSYQSETSFNNMLVPIIGQASSYTSQKGIIKGLDAELPSDYVLDTIGSINFPAFPKYPNKVVAGEVWSRTGKSRDELVSYRNTKFINRFKRHNALKKAIMSWGKKYRGNEYNTVIVYEPGIAKMRGVLQLKKKYGMKVFVVIPDIPELVSLGANKIVRLIKRINGKRLRHLFRDVDGFILYSKHMAEYYGLDDNKWVVMEGVYDIDESNAPPKESEAHPIRLLYCGVLDRFRGIPQLLDAFALLKDKDYELWLTGKGRSEELIRERMKRDNRIKYFGFLKSREEVLVLENKADVLIHTRDVKSPAAPYCFPSKLFEYLATGNQVVSVRIPGIPDEYFNYMTEIKDFTPQGIKNAIEESLSVSTDERNHRGNLAKDFVEKQKNSSVQAKKILDFIGITE